MRGKYTIVGQQFYPYPQRLGQGGLIEELIGGEDGQPLANVKVELDDISLVKLAAAAIGTYVVIRVINNAL